MLFVQQRFPFLAILSTLVVGGGMLAFVNSALRAEVFVDSSPIKQSGAAAVASDLGPVPAEEIAREVLRLQQQLGGSVVKNRRGLQDWNAPPVPVTPKRLPATVPRRVALPANYYQPGTPRPVDKVGELREAAWQLETTAHRLEKLDLYDQADALRGVASRLRRDAREMKQAADR